jgi:hypothetical protein
MKRLLLIIVAILTLLGLYSNKMVNNQPIMKKTDFTAAWDKVQEFESQGLPESALKVVNEIYAGAKEEENASQLVKAVIYIMKLTEYKEESALVKNLNRLEEETRSATFPVKPVLHSMLAEAYWNFYQNNRYQFSQRSQTADFKNDDISTWSLDKIVEEVVKNYRLSLEDTEKSMSTKIDIYQDILMNGNDMGRAYRPTLYDFLAHRAVDFFINQEPDITKPAYAFTINSADYLADAESFCRLNITSKDTLSNKYFALKIFQDLIRFHLHDNEKEALADVDLKRLQFVNQHLVLPDKQELYLAALQQLEQKTIHSPISTIVTCYIANVWVAKGNQFDPSQSDEHQWEAKKAFDICSAAIERFPQSDGAAMCYNLQQQIRAKSVSVNIEKVNVPDIPFRALVSYKNFTTLYWRIIKVTKDEVAAERKRWMNNYDVDQEEKFLEHFIPKTPAKSGSVNLPDEKDYQLHRAEIKLDEVPAGDYMVLLSFNPEYSILSNNLTYSFTTVSNLSYIHRNLDDGSTEFCILDRTTGEPIAGAKAQLFFNVYNSKANRYENIKGDIFTSDIEGFIRVPYQYKQYKNSYYSSFNIDISWQDDRISTRDIDVYNYYGGQLSQYQNSKPQRVTQTLFFLDRAIYRPGQTLYFKGLVYSSDGKDPQIQPNSKHTITFYDVNYQVVASKQFTTNEYGTFSGTFTTPVTGLMGEMRLQIDDSNSSSVSFSVEEYKRPKFEVKFEPVKGSFRLGELIKAVGKATAYSGANIDGAAVSYRVVRQARFPWWWWCWYGYYPSSPEMEITNGTTQTDAEGKYTIEFKAIPDESVNPKSEPIFNYVIYADVTDINGETHTGQSTVSVGYKALEVGVKIDDLDISKEELLKQKFLISTSNLAGEFEPAEGVIKIWKLKGPEKAYRNRMWERPDKQSMTREEFHKFFPHDQFADENNFFKWEKEKEVFNTHFNTSSDKEFGIRNMKSWDLGKYQLEISSRDKFGQDVKEVAYFEVYNTQHKTPSYPIVHRMMELKTTCEPGEEAVLQAVTSEKISALYEIEQDGKIIDRRRVSLTDENMLFKIPIKEEYRGNIAVHYTFVLDSRLYHETTTITVPYTNKQLDVQFETFRNKLQPGQQEEWKIKVTGHKAEKVMAEMVATLYDASLDVFRANNWYANFYNSLFARLNWSSTNGFEKEQFRSYERGWNTTDWRSYNSPSYDQLYWFGLNFYNYNYYEDDMRLEEVVVAGYGTTKRTRSSGAKTKDAEMEKAMPMTMDMAASVEEEKAPLPPAPPEAVQQPQQDMSGVKIRTNFNETAFFYPHLETNENGEIIINFTIPEALTRWKMLGFAHTKELQSGSIINELVTQKDLMVVPNQPRFFRENDKMIFSAKITSLAEKDLMGSAQLEFFDALTMKSVDVLMKNSEKQKPFTIKAKQSTNLEWSIEIPEGVQAITYRIAAKAGNFSDGEEMMIPVVTNRMLVTETMPLPIRGKQSKTFTMEKLVNNTSSTLRNQRFTLEFTSNPAWYAVQALPYMMEYPYECTEQTFSRFYANSIASHIANSNPKIKKVFDTWATIQPDALLSNLEKNQELKTALLEETPWVLNAKDESQRKRNVALLFDLNKMANEMERAMKKIMQAQTGNGGFSWFPGFPEDRYITQHIVAGLGHLDVMGVKSVRSDNRTWQMVQRAIGYMDKAMQDHYEYLKAEAKKGHLNLDDNHLDYTEIHYLYTRSYFKDISIPDRCSEGFSYFMGQAKKYWLQNSIYMQGMMALALDRYDYHDLALPIVKSLSERALLSEEMGMYWKYDRGYYWYQAPIETQALLIEVYDEVAGDKKAVEELKVWLLKQKQVQDWRTTKATSEACYALLRRGTNMLASDTLVEIMVGKELIDPLSRPDTKVEAGTGYFKTAWTAPEITPEMGNITITKKDEGIAWGAIYWQYFEQLDKITPAETPLKLSKQLFLQKNTDRGPVITPVTENTILHTGDLIKVRIELRVDRTMEYIHLKDMRAAAFEPTETLSTYKYQDGLYYYQSPRDLATNFFIGWLPKGTYVFEYPLRVSQKGDFSNGITTIQCMYAPEFSSHSEGIRVKVE